MSKIYYAVRKISISQHSLIKFEAAKTQGQSEKCPGLSDARRRKWSCHFIFFIPISFKMNFSEWKAQIAMQMHAKTRWSKGQTVHTREEEYPGRFFFPGRYANSEVLMNPILMSICTEHKTYKIFIFLCNIAGLSDSAPLSTSNVGFIWGYLQLFCRKQVLKQ